MLDFSDISAAFAGQIARARDSYHDARTRRSLKESEKFVAEAVEEEKRQESARKALVLAGVDAYDSRVFDDRSWAVTVKEYVRTSSLSDETKEKLYESVRTRDYSLLSDESIPRPYAAFGCMRIAQVLHDPEVEQEALAYMLEPQILDNDVVTYPNSPSKALLSSLFERKMDLDVQPIARRAAEQALRDSFPKEENLDKEREREF